MARRPNYNFERAERARIKAAKKAERLQAKADRAAAKKGEGEDGVDTGGEAAGGGAGEPTEREA